MAIALLMAAALASVWELFALQVPGSPFSLGMLPGPIASLRDSAVMLALVLLGVAWLLPWAYQSKEPRLMVGLTYLGVILALSGSLYGAVTGMYGVQITDPRTDATVLFVVKHGGQLLLAGCLLDVAWRVILKKPPE